MKSMPSCTILADGSLVFITRPNIRTTVPFFVLKRDMSNNPLWSGFEQNSPTEIALFISKFNEICKTSKT